MSKKTVITIHGGNSFTNYQEYLKKLDEALIDPWAVNVENWRKRLSVLLGDEFDVIGITMPCKENAKYQEWKIWFEKYIPYITHSTHLVGHSLGAMFLVRYLSENSLDFPIAGVHLVSGGYTSTNSRGNMIDGGGDFYAKVKDLKNLENLQNCIVYHSEDDPIVAFECAQFLYKHVPSVQFNSFTGRGHFLQADFPELVNRIKV